MPIPWTPFGIHGKSRAFTSTALNSIGKRSSQSCGKSEPPGLVHELLLPRTLLMATEPRPTEQPTALTEKPAKQAEAPRVPLLTNVSANVPATPIVSQLSTVQAARPSLIQMLMSHRRAQVSLGHGEAVEKCIGQCRDLLSPRGDVAARAV